MSDNSSNKDGDLTDSITTLGGPSDDPTVESLLTAFKEADQQGDLKWIRIIAIAMADLLQPTTKKQVSEQELIQRLYQAEQQVRKTSTWTHKNSGALVVILDLNLDEETLEPRVSYIHGSVKFSRLISKFLKSFEANPG